MTVYFDFFTVVDHFLDFCFSYTDYGTGNTFFGAVTVEFCWDSVCVGYVKTF